MRLLEPAPPRLRRPGEGAPLVSEELRFDQLFGNRGAVHRHEGLVAPRPRGVQRSGHQLLAGSVFPLDQHPRRGRPGELDLAEHFLDRGRASHDRLGPGSCEPAILLLERERRCRVAEQDQEALQGNGLLEEIEGAETGRLHGGVDGGVPRHHDHDGVGRRFHDLRQQIESASVREPDVEQHEIVGLAELRSGLRDGSGLIHLIAFAPQRARDTRANVGLVVRHEDGHRVPAGPSGNRIRNVVPRSGFGSTATVPSWSFTIRSTIVRPSPLPCAFVVKPGSKR